MEKKGKRILKSWHWLSYVVALTSGQTEATSYMIFLDVQVKAERGVICLLLTPQPQPDLSKIDMHTLHSQETVQ